MDTYLKMFYTGTSDKLMTNTVYLVRFITSPDDDCRPKIAVFSETNISYPICEVTYDKIEDIFKNWMYIKNSSIEAEHVIMGHSYTEDELSNALSVVKTMVQFYTESYKAGFVTTDRLKKTYDVMKDLVLERIKKKE